MSQSGLVDIESSNPQVPTQFDADSGSAVPLSNVLEIEGSTVANATNAKPLFTTGSGNTITAEMQVGAAVTGAPGDKLDAGSVSFDDTSFAVDADGYVTIITGGSGIETVTGDDAVAVSSDGVGNINFTGETVANATNAKPLYIDGDAGTSTQNVEIQVSTERTGAPGNKLDAGVSSYNDTQFSVDADGYVALVGGSDLPSIQTLTSDDPTAVGPDASGDINFTGEAVANATNAKPVFVDAAANAINVEVQVATEITGAPGDKNDAGICSFDDTSFAVDADGYVTLAGGGLAMDSITPDSGTDPVVPTAGGLVTIIGSGSTTTVGGTNQLTVQLTGLTNHAVLVGAGTTTITKVGPDSGTGIPLVSAGASADPAFGTASVGGGGTGVTSFTAGSVIFSNGTILTEDNSNLFWDDTNNRLGIGTATPLDTLHVVGAMELDHTAAENDDHALEMVVDANGFTDVKALDIDYITGALAAGQDEEAILVNIDESASTGGIMAGYLVLATSEGSATVNGYETGINVNPIVHQSGTFSNADNILNKAVDVTAALASGGAGAISIFVADNDTITIGDAAQWGEHEIILSTGASGAGVAPTFEYSIGGSSYSLFSPADGTNGFRNSGAILWDASSLAGWATATSGDYEIRITRTRNTLTTTPIIEELQISALTEFKWDKNGDVNLNSLTLVTPLVETSGGTGTGTYTTGDILYSDSANSLAKLAIGSNTEVLTLAGGVPTWAAPATAGTVTSVSGTVNRISSTGGATPVIDIDAAYVGQASITTLGTITTGVWNGTTVTVPYGGTGEVSLTDGGILLGSGVGNVTVTAQPTNGELLIGSTGVDPVLASLLSADASVTVTPGAGSIDLSVSPSSFATPGIYNLGFDYASGTGVFSITSADGTALSATNIGYVTIWKRESSDPGKLVTIPITANQSFIDDNGVSEIIGNLFGLTTGVAYGQNLPFWIHAVLNNDEDGIAFMLSRVSGSSTTPAAADIGAPDDAVADSQNDYWSFDNIDETLYDLNPSMPIGVIYMQMSASDDWTVQGLYASGSGLNFPSAGMASQNSDQNFAVAQAQFGAATGTHMIANSGTAPTFTTDTMLFEMDTQTVNCWFYLTGNTATDGAGAVTAQIALPYTAACDGGSGNIIVGSGYVISPAYTGMVMFEMTVSTTYCTMRDINGNLLQNQDFSDGNRQITGTVIYRVGANV